MQAALRDAYERYKDLREGSNADYIPALAKVNPNIFGIVLVTVDGRVFTEGDVSSEVSIQSVSKVLTLARVLQERGAARVDKTIGVDATGLAFNSIVAVERHAGARLNPLVNPGAITATSMLAGASYDQIWNDLLAYYSEFAGHALAVIDAVYESEAANNQRNRAIAMLMHAYGHIKDDPMRACDLYTRQCSVGVNARDLAVMAATLANGGVNPITGKVSEEMSGETWGLYESSGQWLYDTGLPAKSGVGGGLIAVCPGRFGIAVVSPLLDKAGNSVRGQRAITDIARALGANPYLCRPIEPKPR
ncbi:MAG: glutaminase [Proteobacteria bacterium]|nr:glutaminase [Pseudomonadota bacterium]